MTPDAELVRRTLTGDRESFGELYDRYARLVRAVAADAGPAAPDITQETFLRAYRSLGQLRDADRVGPWLVGIARTVVREHRRSRKLEPLTADVPGNDPTLVEATDEAAHLLRQVARLPDDERLAVHFYFLMEQNADETARLLNRSRSGTYALLKRALATLGGWLSNTEVRT